MSEPGYFVHAGASGGTVLAARPYDGRMVWQSDSRYYVPMTKAKAEWFCAIVKQRAVEDASQSADARVVADYWGRDAGQFAMPSLSLKR